MASEREPGFYWMRLRDGGWRPVEMCNGAQRVLLFGGRAFEQSDVTEWGPRIYPPDAEHPDASLRERLGALADAAQKWEAECDLAAKQARSADESREHMSAAYAYGRCVVELRALLRTE